MRFRLALWVGKLLAFLTKFTGRGTNIVGELAMKLDPALLRGFTFDGKIIAVTGSNGKTSTSNMIAYVLRQAGYTVVNNGEGSNLTGGVATTLIKGSDMGGRVHGDFVVLEVDERYSRLIFQHFDPHYMVVTNLFRDQLTRNGNVDVITAILNQTIRPNVKLILNANDPISGNLAPQNPRVYYGMDRTEKSSDQCLNITHDAKVCPRCFGHMEYEYYHYNHIGKFHCAVCGYETPEMAYRATDLDLAAGDFKVNGIPVHTELKSLFNVLNMTAVLAICTEVGMDTQKAAQILSTFVVSKLRYDEFQVGGRRGVMLLSKNQNPVSYDQSISYLLEDEGEKTVVVYVNNINHTNNKDTTWLYDINFERLLGKVHSIVAVGPRAYDLAVRLDLAGFPQDQVKVCCDISQAAAPVADTQGTLYLMTELYDAKAIVEVLKGGK